MNEIASFGSHLASVHFDGISTIFPAMMDFPSSTTGITILMSWDI
jgi:hypothetical protein